MSNELNTYPYNDKYMRYDMRTHRYVLTVDYFIDVMPVELARRTQNNVQSQNTVNALLDRASNLIYGYLAKHNDAQTIQYIIAKCPSARQIIMDALGSQCVYMFTVGDLTLSPKPDDRAAWLDMGAENILNGEEVIETGCVLTNVGEYSFCPPSYEKGGY